MYPIINTGPLTALRCRASPGRKTGHSAGISEGEVDRSDRVHQLFPLKSVFTTRRVSD